jgi:hypothetical protein
MGPAIRADTCQNIRTAIEHRSLRRLDRLSKEVLRARYEARRTSSQLFEDLVQETELKIRLPVATAANYQVDLWEVSERRKWLKQYGNEIQQDKVSRFFPIVGASTNLGLDLHRVEHRS